MGLNPRLKEICSKLTLLYVEDDKDTRDQYERIFQLLFREVLTAENGVEALEVYAQSPCDLVITDLTMPKMDGIILIGELRKRNEKQHIIVMTAHNTSENLRDSIELMVDGILIKPVAMQKLGDLLFKTCQSIYLEQNQEIPADTQSRKEALVRMLENGEYAVCLALIDGFDALVKEFGVEVKSPIIEAARSHLSNFGMEDEDSVVLDEDVLLFMMPKRYLDEFLRALQHFSENNRALQVKVGESTIYITLSFGVVSTRPEASTAGKNKLFMEYLENVADQIRNDIKSTFVVAMDIDIDDLQEHNALQWLRRTQEAIRQGAVVPMFQPIVNLVTMETCAYEVYARIKEGNEYILPKFFIDLSQKAGILEDISQIIFKKSFEIFSSNNYRLHINITDSEWRDNVLEHFLSYLSASYDVKPSRVVLNVSNYQDMSLEGKTMKRLLRLKEMGYCIALKEFGTQSINIELLSTLQPDVVKFDQLMIRRAMHDVSMQKVVEMLINYAKGVKIGTVIVGVEDEAVLNFSKNLGLDCAQGYLIQRPAETL